MLLFKDGRFYAKGISFVLPDGFYLRLDVEGYYEGMMALTPNKKTLVIWQVLNNDRRLEDDIRDFVTENPEYHFTTDIEPLILNGLSGCQIIHKGKRVELYEARFALSDNRMFHFSFDSRTKPIQEILESPVIQTALNGIRAEEVYI